jgi:protein gp37
VPAVKAKIRFISCEPLLEELKFPSLKGVIYWMIIGAQSKRGESPEIQPDVGWVLSLIDQARKAGCQVYCKPNLKWAIKEYPGAGGQ